jgi:hypothetical protein
MADIVLDVLSQGGSDCFLHVENIKEWGAVCARKTSLVGF